MGPQDAALEQRRTTPVELFWDLVFVFAITQVSTLLAGDLSWAGLGRAMLVLALVWWAWSAFVWMTNAHDPDAPHVRAALFGAMILTFLVALAVPGAWGAEATLFAVAYACVRFVHLALYVDAARRGNASLPAIAGFSVTVAIGMALLIAGSLVGEPLRAVLWVVAAAIDYAGPAWLTRERLAALQRVAVAHFAERYSLFIIICLGESIVAIGLGAEGLAVDGELAAGVVVALLVTVGLWWTYFDHVATAAEERLAGHEEPVLAAADAYSYLHLLLVAGIIAFAVGAKEAVGHAADPLGDAARLALCGGVALYLAGHIAFGLRMMGAFSRPKAIAALACLAVYALAGGLPAWATAGIVAAVLGLLVIREHALEAPGAPIRRTARRSPPRTSRRSGGA
jgi:low temperature requirement protein LtrA